MYKSALSCIRFLLKFFLFFKFEFIHKIFFRICMYRDHLLQAKEVIPLNASISELCNYCNLTNNPILYVNCFFYDIFLYIFRKEKLLELNSSIINQDLRCVYGFPGYNSNALIGIKFFKIFIYYFYFRKSSLFLSKKRRIYFRAKSYRKIRSFSRSRYIFLFVFSYLVSCCYWNFNWNKYEW